MEKRSGTMHMTLVPGKGFLITKKLVSRIVTNPIYIGWWIWGGEIVNKDNHPPIVDEETFWRVQEKFGARKARGRAVYDDPFVLENLLFCISEKHPEPSRVSASKSDDRYRCKGAIEIGRSDHDCFSTRRRVLDIPVEEFVVSQCSYPQYTERIVKQLGDSYDAAKAKAEANKKEVERLTREIEKLKENLAYTKTQEQTEMILGMIDERIAEKKKKSAVETFPAGRVGQAFQIYQVRLDKVKHMFENLQNIWSRNPPRHLKNEFLGIILEQVQVKHEPGQFRVFIRWQFGLKQEILIHKLHSNSNSENRWTDAEVEILREKYPSAEWKDVFESLPRKSISAVLSKAQRLGIIRTRVKGEDESRTRCDWTEEEDNLQIGRAHV
jgi:hypothetical protein